MSLRELTKEYLTKAVYQTPLDIMKLMAAALPLGEGTVLDVCGGSEDFLLRAGAIKQKKGEEELLVIENWTGAEDTTEGRENVLYCGPVEKVSAYLKKEPKREKFDYVLMNPPFGYTRGEGKGSRTRVESQFLSQVVDCMEETGYCVAVAPNGLLTRTAGEDIELRQRFVENCHIEQVILLPLSSFLPFAEVRTGLLVFSREKEDGMTRVYDLRKVERLETLADVYKKSLPACVLNRTTLAQHQYILSSEEYLEDVKVDEHVLLNQERALKRRLKQLSGNLPSAYENESGQIGLFPCQRGIQNRKGVLKEILDCEYGLLECDLLRLSKREKWPEVEGSSFLKLWSGKRWDEAEKDGPYRVYGAAGVQGTAKNPSMEEDTAVLIGRVGSYCGAVYKAWSRGFVSDNVMLVGGKDDQAEEDFMILLLKAAHFNAEKRGSVQPYITKNIVLKRRYPLPDLKRQQKFLSSHRDLFEKIKREEQEIEELSMDKGAVGK